MIARCELSSKRRSQAGSESIWWTMADSGCGTVMKIAIGAVAIVLVSSMAHADIAKDKYRQNLRACIARQAACVVGKLGADDRSYLTTELKGQKLPSDAIDDIVDIRMRYYAPAAGSAYMSDAELTSYCNQDSDWRAKGTACRLLASKPGISGRERASALAQSGRAALYSGHSDEAAMAFHDAIDEAPALPQSHFEMGEFLRAQGKFPEAMLQFREAIRLDQNYANPHAGSGYVLLKQGFFNEAKAEFDAALSLDSTLQLALVGKKDLAAAMDPGVREDLHVTKMGHYVADALINGHKIPVMVDTGATVVAIPAEVAAEIGISPDPSEFTVKVKTANGQTSAAMVMLSSIKIGNIEVTDVKAIVGMPHALPGVLLGMSFLSKLKQFSVSDDTLTMVK